MDYEITEEEKQIAKRIRELFKADNEYFFKYAPADDISRLRKMGQTELADFLEDLGKRYGYRMQHLISEVMVDEAVGDELKELEEKLK